MSLLNRERACSTPLGCGMVGVFWCSVPRVAPWAIMLDAVGVLLFLHGFYPHKMEENQKTKLSSFEKTFVNFVSFVVLISFTLTRTGLRTGDMYR